MVSESHPEMSTLNNTIATVNDTILATAVAPVLPVAGPSLRFPAAMLRPREDPRLSVPGPSRFAVGDHVTAVRRYKSFSDARRSQIRQRHINDLEHLHKMLILEATSRSWELHCALRPLAERQGQGPHTVTQYISMIRNASEPSEPYVAVERDPNVWTPLLVVRETELVYSDPRFRHQDGEARVYRASVARMLHRYYEQCGPWTGCPGYHSFSHSVLPLTGLDNRVLEAHLDQTICDILAVAFPSGDNRTGPSAPREATELKKQQCMQSLYVAMAEAALASGKQVEPMFLVLATERAAHDSENSIDDHVDMDENIAQQLRTMLKSFKLNDCAQAISLSVSQMTADEYDSPPAEGVCPTDIGVAGQPFCWDMFGHFHLQSLTLAQSIVRKTMGSLRNHEFGPCDEIVVKEIMQILCPLVKYYGGGRSYDKHRQQLITTLDLEEEVHQIARDFIHYRSHQSESVGAGDHEAKFIDDRIVNLVNYHLVNNRSLSQLVLRQCGWNRRRLGEEISSRVHSLVLSYKLLFFLEITFTDQSNPTAQLA